MIRFLNLKDQLAEGNNAFAFFDTVKSEILKFGVDQEQVFDDFTSWKDAFYESFPEATKEEYLRFTFLIPYGYFEKNPWEDFNKTFNI